MVLKLETFSNIKGGNSFFKALTHPAAAPAAAALRDKIRAAKALAVFDPDNIADSVGGFFNLQTARLAGVYVQAVDAVGKPVLGTVTEAITALPRAGADLVFILAFDADRIVHRISHLLGERTKVVTLDAMRLAESYLSHRGNYLDPINFATNFAFFRDQGGFHTRVVTTNYWSGYGATAPNLMLTLFDEGGAILAEWTQSLGPANASVVLDSASIRRQFGLPEFTGQLFIHVTGAVGHDIVKYALDTWQDDGPSLSCTHDSNVWPADYYAGLPAPRADETVTLWLQNCLPVAIPSSGVALNLMGDATAVPIEQSIPAFATLAVDVAAILPAARWPQQIEIAAGRHVVRPRYEVRRGPRVRIAHPNVERTDLKPDPRIAGLAEHLGKGFILPAPILPVADWRSHLLPTPMARSQEVLPIAAVAYDPLGRETGRHRFGRLTRRDSVAIDTSELLRDSGAEWGHVELVYDFTAGDEADGWLHALFRFEHRDNDHAADSSFGAHVFNTLMTWGSEPQSYKGKPPGLSTRLFLRLGDEPLDTICHLIYPASQPWLGYSATDVMLIDGRGETVAMKHLRIACGGSVFWRYREIFSADERRRAGPDPYVTVRDRTCRLFGYHGLVAASGAFSFDHMFGY
jgi:hypothetical protein